MLFVRYKTRIYLAVIENKKLRGRGFHAEKYHKTLERGGVQCLTAIVTSRFFQRSVVLVCIALVLKYLLDLL